MVAPSTLQDSLLSLSCYTPLASTALHKGRTVYLGSTNSSQPQCSSDRWRIKGYWCWMIWPHGSQVAQQRLKWTCPTAKLLFLAHHKKAWRGTYSSDFPPQAIRGSQRKTLHSPLLSSQAHGRAHFMPGACRGGHVKAFERKWQVPLPAPSTEGQAWEPPALFLSRSPLRWVPE